ncbi:MAG: FtsX-like permease family protein [Bacteroidales bacterium]
MGYISRRDIGLDKNVIEVKIPYQYEGMANVFREEVSRDPSISMVSVVPASPLLEYMMALFHYTEDGVDKQYTPAIFSGDENFISTLGIELLEGRNFSVDLASDRRNVIINESLSGKFTGRKLLGEKLPGDDERIVIGIVKDFNYTGLKDKIEPGIIIYNNTGNHLLIKPVDGMMQAARSRIKETWVKLIPDYPLNIESVRERYEWFHRDNSNYVKFIGSCCIISLFLSMIGLYAISLNTSKKRTKEIGIRRINGASIREVIILLNSGFLKWVLISFIIAAPLSGYFMHKWLENFAYKTTISWWIFAISGVIAFAITLLTVSWQSWHASIQDPVDSLRHD